MPHGMFLGHLELQVLGPFLMDILVDCSGLSICSDALIGATHTLVPANSSKETQVGGSQLLILTPDMNPNALTKVLHIAEDHLCRWPHGYL